MFYDSELRFICDVFSKKHIKISVLPQSEAALINSIRDGLINDSVDTDGLRALFCDMKPRTLYKIKDNFHRCFLCLLLPENDSYRTMLIGPYLSEPILQDTLFMLGEENNIPPQKQKYFSEYYQSLPVMGEGSSLVVMFNTFCETLWRSPSFPIVELYERLKPLYSSDLSFVGSTESEDSQIDIVAMERRYSFENKIIRAVSLGQLHMEGQLFSSLSNDFFEKRVSDPLRNAKNYAIIMNTLLRKAAESGGVHPLYIHRASSDIARKIEDLSSAERSFELMCEIFRIYCRLVQRHSMLGYSPVVKKTVLKIDSDLSADISPKTLAQGRGVSLGYLSTVFRKEVGKTISEYIRDKRIEYAIYLLRTTSLQVQTVALHCGIMDVQYFSKIFKRQTGKSPTEYRDECNKR